MSFIAYLALERHIIYKNGDFLSPFSPFRTQHHNILHNNAHDFVAECISKSNVESKVDILKD